MALFIKVTHKSGQQTRINMDKFIAIYTMDGFTRLYEAGLKDAYRDIKETPGEIDKLIYEATHGQK